MALPASYRLRRLLCAAARLAALLSSPLCAKYLANGTCTRAGWCCPAALRIVTHRAGAAGVANGVCSAARAPASVGAGGAYQMRAWLPANGAVAAFLFAAHQRVRRRSRRAAASRARVGWWLSGCLLQLLRLRVIGTLL